MDQRKLSKYHSCETNVLVVESALECVWLDTLMLHRRVELNDWRISFDLIRKHVGAVGTLVQIFAASMVVHLLQEINLDRQPDGMLVP